jgi:phenylacetate-CoA ligase
LHQTSGSGGGAPMRWLDTPDNWQWWKKLWGIIYAAAGVTRGDRMFFPFSFGPFVGFWAAFESAAALGNLSLSGGGMTTPARLRFMLDNACTVVCCTPTYALRMAEVAAAEGIDLPAAAAVTKLIVAGEPGGSIPATRQRIERAWGARVFDHTGMTEIGALGFECAQAPGGVHLIESECIAEVIDPATGRAVADGEEGELVLTNLGRWDSPLIRYRTNDQVRLTRGRRCTCGRWFARMEGGILGRIDDMVVVRGNNIFPASLEAIIRRFDAVAEFRVQVVDDASSLTRLRVDVEPATGSDPAQLTRAVARAIQDALNFRADVHAVAAGSLPRFDMKARRFTRTMRRT